MAKAPRQKIYWICAFAWKFAVFTNSKEMAQSIVYATLSSDVDKRNGALSPYTVGVDHNWCIT